MKNITGKELRQMWHEFYVSKGHTPIGSASVIPENDPTVLFTTAGMHPLVPYLMGEKHPAGKRLVNAQKCIRTGDIDEVGDDSHCTFFEMLGNWSLGDYFKKEQIEWSWEFLTSPAYLGIDPKRIAVSVFAGDEDAPRDEESALLWQKAGMSKDRIFYLPKKNNWWGPAGKTGPCGPDTEMFIISDKAKCGKDCTPACDCGKYLEIWNDVFMQYNKTTERTFEPLKQKNVDTGMGLERTLAVLQGKKSVYDTDLFLPIIAKIEELTPESSAADITAKTRAMRIVADHIRASVHMIGDVRGISPSNVDQGYVLRRLIRRAIRFGGFVGLPQGGIIEIAKVVVKMYQDAYPEIKANSAKIIEEIRLEEERFQKTITSGLKEFDKLRGYLVGDTVSGKAAFKLYDTYGFPIEMTEELAAENNLKVDRAGFDKAFAEHQEKSQAGSEKKFKGGLADDTVATSRLHTATHLMHAALKKILGEGVNQKGSNITEERLRFDFSFARPMTPDEIRQVEDLVNKAIKADIEIICTQMSVPEAKKNGAIGLFDSKYAADVKVYQMGEYSLEICGGPHALRTGELGVFKIAKEQSSSAGVRRIKGILEKI